MKDESQILLRIFFKVVLINLICFVAYVYPESVFFHLGNWLLAFLFIISIVFDTWKFYNLRKVDPNSRFHGSLYWFTLGTSVIGAIGVFILGLNNIFIYNRDYVGVFSAILGIFLVSAMFIGPKWFVMRTKDPYKWLRIILPSIQLVLLMLVSATTIVESGRNITLLELAFMKPLEYLESIIYLLIVVILIGCYLTQIAQTRWGAILSFVLSIITVILQILVFLDYPVNDSYLLLLPSIFLGIFSLVPNVYWINYYGNIPKYENKKK